ncbi:hypothetical protein GCM10010332_32840 [Streptomyces albogriseolus]|nr:hypothetical protein GCM10010332_32840 [Streptomyces albogriseolus]
MQEQAAEGGGVGVPLPAGDVDAPAVGGVDVVRVRRDGGGLRVRVRRLEPRSRGVLRGLRTRRVRGRLCGGRGVLRGLRVRRCLRRDVRLPRPRYGRAGRRDLGRTGVRGPARRLGVLRRDRRWLGHRASFG